MKKYKKETGLVEKMLKIREKLNELYMNNPIEYFKRLENRKKQMLKNDKAK